MSRNTLLSPDINKINLKEDDRSKIKNESIAPYKTSPITSIKPISSWNFIQSRTLTSEGIPVCLSENIEQGTQCIVSKVNQNDSSQLWKLTNDGHILSRVKGNYVIDSINKNHIILNEWNDSLSQIWHFNNYGQIVNDSDSNLCIGMKNSTEIIIGKPDSNDNKCFQWDTVPSYPLDSILTQPTQQFPQYKGNQLVAFVDISQQLVGVDNIREEYTNLTAPLSFFQAQLQRMSYPDYLTHEEFDEIRDQLYKEFEYSQAIINLFKNYQDFHSELFEDDSSRLNQLVSLCQLEQGSTFDISGCILQLFSGIQYTVLASLPGPGVLIGNLIATAINVGLAANSGHKTINPEPFQITLSQLWAKVSSSFEALLKNIGTMETMLLQNWGMMRSVYYLTTKLSGSDSLAWKTSMTGDMINAAVLGYENSVLQMLMPTKYQIYIWDPKNNGLEDPPNNIPDYCKWTGSNNILYWIADKEHINVYPAQDLMNLVWNNNVEKPDLYLSENGWNFPISQLNGYYYSNTTPTITNKTPTPMKFQIQFDNNPSQVYSYNLPTYSSTVCLELNKKGSGTNLEITILDIYHNYIATLNIHVINHFMRGSTVTLKDSNVNNGYFIGSPICNRGSYSDSFTSSINISIYEDPNYNQIKSVYKICK